MSENNSISPKLSTCVSDDPPHQSVVIKLRLLIVVVIVSIMLSIAGAALIPSLAIRRQPVYMKQLNTMQYAAVELWLFALYHSWHLLPTRVSQLRQTTWRKTTCSIHQACYLCTRWGIITGTHSVKWQNFITTLFVCIEIPTIKAQDNAACNFTKLTHVHSWHLLPTRVSQLRQTTWRKTTCSIYQACYLSTWWGIITGTHSVKWQNFITTLFVYLQPFCNGVCRGVGSRNNQHPLHWAWCQS